MTCPLVSQLVGQQALLISNAPEGLRLLALPHCLGLSHLSLSCGSCVLLHSRPTHESIIHAPGQGRLQSHFVTNSITCA